MKKYIPKIESKLKDKIVQMPEAIFQASGINIYGKRIKSLLFTTDLALLKNSNAQSIMAVYPFTPQISITQAIIENSPVPVFVGVGGGRTSGERSVQIALMAELLGAYGVVVNTPMPLENIRAMKEVLDVPIISTVVSEHDLIEERFDAGVSIFNVSGEKDTPKIVSKIRHMLGKEIPIIATGGPTEEDVLKTIESGANAITYTPPTSAELFGEIMKDYRKQKEKESKE